MDLSLGNTPQGMPGNIPGQIPSSGTAPIKEPTALPLTEQPIQDNTSQAEQLPIPPAANYNGTSQTPTLTKPAEQKPETQDKKAEKEVSGETGQAEQGDGATPVDGEPNAPEEQKEGEQSDGQGGGGSEEGGSSSNSGGSSSGGFSDGRGSESRSSPTNINGAGKPETNGNTAPAKGNGTTQTAGNPASSSNTATPVAVNNTATPIAANNTGSASVTANSTGAAPVAAHNASAQVAATKSVVPPNKGTPAESAEAAYLSAINPTGTVTLSASGLFSPPLNPAQFFDNGGKIAQEMTDMVAKLAASMPEGPEKVRFLDFLKLVQDALSQFQQLLRELQMKDSKGATDRSKAALEASLAKIENQREEQAKMAEKSEAAAKKAKIMGPLAVFFAFLLVILLAVLMLLFLATLLMTFPPLGAMVIPLIVGAFLDQCATVAGKKPFAIELMAKAVMGLIDAFVESCYSTFGGSEESLKSAKAAFKTITVAFVIIISTLLAPGLILFGGVTALLSFLSESHVARDCALAAGMKKEDAEKVEMYTGIAVGALFAVAALGVGLVMPGGAIGGVASAALNGIKSAAKAAADVALKLLMMIPRMADKVANGIAKTIEGMIRVLLDPQNWIAITGLGLQTTVAVTNYQLQMILADIALIQGQMDADIELADATIQMLKKMIKQLLDGLQGIADDMSSLTQLLKKTHTGVSEVTSNLFG